MKLSNKILFLTLAVILPTLIIIFSLFAYLNFTNNFKREIEAAIFRDKTIITTFLRSDKKSINDLYVNFHLQNHSPIFLKNEKVIFSGSEYELKETILANKSNRFYLLKEIKNRPYLLIINKFKVDDDNIVTIGQKNLSNLYESNYNIIRILIILLILSIMIITILLKKVSYSVTKPLKKLISVMDLFSSELYNTRAEESGTDEIKALSIKFNSMSEQIESDVNKLIQSNADKDKFISNFTHELKTPLTNIIGYSELMLKREFNKDERKKYLETINHEGLRLHHLGISLRDYLLYKNYKIQNNEVNIAWSQEQIKNIVKLILKTKNIKFICDTTDLDIILDFNLYKTVIVNIIENAVKASEIDKAIEFRQYFTSDKFITEIKDYGCGIDKKEIEHLFKPFYQIEESRTDRQNGFGIGLSLVRIIIEDILCGNLEVISEKNVGTTIIIYLPLLNLSSISLKALNL